MGGFLQRLFFGLGVTLGVVAPQSFPDLSVLLFRNADQVMANAEAEGAISGSAYELADSGTRIAVKFTFGIEGSGLAPIEVVRSVWRDASANNWIVAYAPEGDEKNVPTGDAAAILAGRAWNVRVCPLKALQNGGTVVVQATVGIIDESGGWHSAGILWGYEEPSRRFFIKSTGEMSY